jgi:2-dehydro-3-deoxyphosphogluconate aldolase/(4S)-4-hydroxy-2-oxoglutarate aldolase
VRTSDRGLAEPIGVAAIEAGLDVLEVSLTSPDALSAIERLSSQFPAATIGAGTVLDGSSARLAVLAGARFLVAPALVPEVIRTGHRYGAAVIPGAATASEIESALSAGADLIKLFPAGHFGPSYLRAVRASLPQAAIVPTGGIDATNASEWFAAGAIAVGVGSGFTKDADVAAERAALLVEALAA